MKHVVMFSGGVGSWAAATRVAARYGTGDMTLLFADTMVEDGDLYRFLEDAAFNIGVPLTRIADGRTPWDVFFDERFIGNTRVDICSRILKRDLLDKWLKVNCDPSSTTVHLGIDWSEKKRFDGVDANGEPRGAKHRYAALGWVCEAMMCDRPYLAKQTIFDALKSHGIRAPRLYGQGFAHNNCGGACVKSGHAQWALLLKVNRMLFLWWETKEQEFIAKFGKNVAILRDRTGGVTRPLPLKEFRERIEAEEYSEQEQGQFEWGGCGCAID